MKKLQIMGFRTRQAPTRQDLESFFRQKYYTAKLDPQGNGLAFLVPLSHPSINKLRGADVLGKLSLIWFYLQDSPSCHFSLGVWLLIHAHVASHSLTPHRQPTGKMVWISQANGKGGAPFFPSKSQSCHLPLARGLVDGYVVCMFK
ncbi:uncharacterized protein LOC120073162 [Benincasa hispida]|uniref:uncharacterized protein LOC120073162 n=1 Tax=Benincasa hispida TaxID=102211 RepID=UPI0019005BA3|nr:uncharacterized protein LOC120073162 [Benincasa hispida]